MKVKQLLKLIIILVMSVLMIIQSSSCQSVNHDLKKKIKLDFTDYYSLLQDLKKESNEVKALQKFTFSASNMNFREFAFWFNHSESYSLLLVWRLFDA